jgi:hypothetical protein
VIHRFVEDAARNDHIFGESVGAEMMEEFKLGPSLESVDKPHQTADRLFGEVRAVKASGFGRRLFKVFGQNLIRGQFEFVLQSAGHLTGD